MARGRLLRLEIDPVIARAEAIVERIDCQLPGHPGIARAAAGVAAAACEAKRVARVLHRPWGLHQLPAFFLAVALALFAAWVYWQFFHVTTLTVAIPERDAVELRKRLAAGDRVRFRQVLTEGSRENARRLQASQVDLAFVQGGVPIDQDLPRMEIPDAELVLFFVRPGIDHPTQVQRVLTSVEGQGSHCVLQDFVHIWQIEDRVQYVHQWTRLAGEAPYELPDSVDAVFAIKDPANESVCRAARRLAEAGFHLFTPDLGARAGDLDYLRPGQIPRAYFGWQPLVPEQPVATYSVTTYLVARRGLTPRLRAAAAHLLDSRHVTLAEAGFEPTFSDAGDVLQTVEALLGILVYIGLAFLTLLGLEVIRYRRRFHELNTLISLISMHQSEKDVLGLSNKELQRENMLYLRICSDLLGLISVISGYYTQENSSLLYSNLLEIIHHRCSGLKLNIQTKILHASLEVAPDAELAPAIPEPLGDE
jgi:hypothetical protein